LENEGTPRVPSIGTLVRVVAYLAFVLAIGVSFSYSLELVNKVFYLGAALTLGNLFLCFLFLRHLAIRHRYVVAKFFN